MRKPFDGILSKAAARNLRYAIFGAVALAAGFSSRSAIRLRQDTATKEPAAAPAKAPQPEMQKLDFYLGEWDYTEKYEKTKMFPNGAQNSGVYSSKAGPGGSSIVQHFQSKGTAGEFEGMIVMTWDAKEKKYKGYAFAADYAGCIVEDGTFENEVLEFRSEFSMGPTKVATRYTTKLLAPNKLEAAEYVATNGGPEKLFMKVEATKR